MHLDLSEFQEGASAELRDQAPYGLVKFIQKIQPKLVDDEGNEKKLSHDEQLEVNEQIMTNILKRMVSSWKVKDLDGKEVPKPSEATPDQMDSMDIRILSKVVEAAQGILNRSNADPNSASVSS